MSIMICQKCDKEVDTDHDLGFFDLPGDEFLCDECGEELEVCDE